MVDVRSFGGIGAPSRWLCGCCVVCILDVLVRPRFESLHVVNIREVLEARETFDTRFLWKIHDWSTFCIMTWEFSCFFSAIFVSALVFCFLCPWQLQLLLLCCASIGRCCGSGSLEDYIRGHHSQRQAIGLDRHVVDHRRLHLHGHRLQLLPKVLRFGRRRRSGSKMPWHVHRNSIFVDCPCDSCS